MVIKQYFQIIKTNKLFTSLAPEELISLLEQQQQKISTYAKGSLIHIENEECCTFDLILEGQVIVQKIHANGNVLTVSEFTQGENLGGNLIFADKNTYPMTISAKTDCTILHLDKELILLFCQLNKNFLTEFIKSLSNKTTFISNKLESISMRTIRQRIYEFLIHEYYQQKTLNIHLKFTKKEWSEKLGIQRPSLSRELIKMKEEGLIDYNRSHILIKDLAVLTKNFTC